MPQTDQITKIAPACGRHEGMIYLRATLNDKQSYWKCMRCTFPCNFHDRGTEEKVEFSN